MKKIYVSMIRMYAATGGAQAQQPAQNSIVVKFSQVSHDGRESFK